MYVPSHLGNILYFLCPLNKYLFALRVYPRSFHETRRLLSKCPKSPESLIDSLFPQFHGDIKNHSTERGVRRNPFITSAGKMSRDLSKWNTMSPWVLIGDPN